MTKTLLVNCYGKNPEKINSLKDVLGRYSQVIVFAYSEIGIGFQIPKDIDTVVVSGSEARIVNPEERAKYTGVLDLIKNCNLPLIGICYGHQLLCAAFGAKTGSLTHPVKDRFEQVRLIEKCEIFTSFREGQTITLAQWHNDYVKKDGLGESGFRLLADSSSCEVEAVKHETKPFYGVQFHPERVKIKGETHAEGHQVIENFYVNRVKR
jgi:GMP synthase (glutamine-hydrolysing)